MGNNANEDGLVELERDDPQLGAQDPPKTENEQSVKEFQTTGRTEAHRQESSDPTIQAQRDKAAKKADK